MTTLSSTEFVDTVKSKGIEYIPSDKMFYSKYYYKLTIGPAKKQLGPHDYSICKIVLKTPGQAQAALDAFTRATQDKIDNMKNQVEIEKFLRRFESDQYQFKTNRYKTMVYSNNLEILLALVDKFNCVSNTMLGPINTNHKNMLNNIGNKVLRKTYLYQKYKYRIVIPNTEEFISSTGEQLLSWLSTLPKTAWASTELENAIDYYQAYKTLSTKHRSSILSYNDNIILYLTDHEHYVYVKLLVNRDVIESNEVVLFDELS